MSHLFWWSILLVVIIISSSTPQYHRYQLYLYQKLGYWNIFIPILIALIANIIGIQLSGRIIIFLLIPLDIVFLIDAIFTFFRIKKEKSNN